MTQWNALPIEIVTLILNQIILDLPLNQCVLNFRSVSHQFDDIILNQKSGWQPFLDYDDFQHSEDKQPMQMMEKKYPTIESCYKKLNAILNLTIPNIERSDERAQKADKLQKEALDNLISAKLCVYYPEFKQALLFEEDNQHPPYFHNGLRYITNIAMKYESIAHFILKNAAFRKQFLTHRHGLDYLNDIAAKHESIALLIIEDNELCHAMTTGPYAINYIQSLVSVHESAFLNLYRHSHVKELFINKLLRIQNMQTDSLFGDHLAQQTLLQIGLKHKVFFSNSAEDIEALETWTTHSPTMLIDYIYNILSARQTEQARELPVAPILRNSTR